MLLLSSVYSNGVYSWSKSQLFSLLKKAGQEE